MKCLFISCYCSHFILSQIWHLNFGIEFQVECLELSVDGTLLATGGRDNNIVLSTINVNEDEVHKFSRIQKSFGHKEHGHNRQTKGGPQHYLSVF